MHYLLSTIEQPDTVKRRCGEHCGEFRAVRNKVPDTPVGHPRFHPSACFLLFLCLHLYTSAACNFYYKYSRLKVE